MDIFNFDVGPTGTYETNIGTLSGRESSEEHNICFAFFFACYSVRAIGENSIITRNIQIFRPGTSRKGGQYNSCRCHCRAFLFSSTCIRSVRMLGATRHCCSLTSE